MKTKVYTRPVSVVLTNEAFEQIKAITDDKGTGISDYIREAIQEKLCGNTKGGTTHENS